MICAHCQASNPEVARFCLNCGKPLTAPRPVEGERKFATVLFADVAGSTATAERLDPEEWTEIMNGAFAFMNAAVTRYGGTVARLMGDAVLALFGAPTAHEDDAERAVRSALDIREAAVRYAEVVRERHGVDFAVRVGLNTGLAVLATVGDDTKMEYTAMGDAANVAARLQSAARPGTVLISAETQALVRQLFDFAPRGQVDIRGKSLPVESYEVLAAKRLRGKQRGLEAEGLSAPLVGRDSQLELLRARLEGLAAGRGAFVAVLGEAGIGKTRLIAEARQMLAPVLAARWLEARAVSYGQALSYDLWQQLLRGQLEVQDADPPAVVRDRLRLSLAQLGLTHEALPFLEVLLGVESEASAEAVAGLEGNELVQRLTEALRGYLRALAGQAPLILVLDDLHWADPASLELLFELADLVQAGPLAMVGLSRPDKAAASWALLARLRARLAASYSEIALEPLDAAQARELLGSLLYIEDLPQSVRALILRKSEGNPFFLEEVLRSLIASGHLIRTEGHWRATRDIMNVAIPDTLIGVLSARIDRLPDDTKRVAQTAAVIGRRFAQRVLAEVCALAPAGERIDNVDPHLATLTFEELVREWARTPETEHMFKHALTQEAAYDLLLLRRRKELHRRAARVLERLHEGRRAEFAPVLARHFWLGEDWQMAFDYAMQAGGRAVKLYALDEALEHYETAYQAAGKLQGSAPGLRVDAVVGWVMVAYKLRLHERVETRSSMLERLWEAERLARSLGDARRLVRALVWLGNVLTLSGFPGTAFPLMRESYELALALDDEELALSPLFSVTWEMVDNDPAGALPNLDKIIADTRRFRSQPGSREIETHALALKAVAQARLGEFVHAQAAMQEALELLPQANSAMKEADVNLGLAMALYDMGELQRGLELSRHGKERALSVRGMECACAGALYEGLGHLWAKNLEEALRGFQESLELGEDLEAGSEGMANQVRAGIAMVQIAGGNLGAVADLEEALTKAQGISDAYGAAFIAQGLADSYRQLGDFERAERHLAAALAYYRRTGMKPYLMRALQLLATLHEAQGKPAEAARVSSEAEALRQELQAAPPVAEPRADMPVQRPQAAE